MESRRRTVLKTICEKSLGDSTVHTVVEIHINEFSGCRVPPLYGSSRSSVGVLGHVRSSCGQRLLHTTNDTKVNFNMTYLTMHDTAGTAYGFGLSMKLLGCC